MTVIGLIVGLVMLFFGGEWLVTGASRLARSLGISALVVGLTIVAIGTSMPELLVSLNAVLTDSADISVGNVIGSNIANIGLILGITGLIYPISVHVQLLRREIPIMLGVVITGFLVLRDGEVGRIDGLILVAMMIAFIVFMIISSRREQKIKHDIPEDEEVLEPGSVNRNLEILRLIAGIVILLIGARLTVDNAEMLAHAIGISERIIGITVIAIGTSLPELVTSVMAAFRKESDIAIGNVVGSNIFNIVGILGITSLVKPLTVAPRINEFDAWVMLGFSLLLIPFVWNAKVGRFEAALFLIAYGSFIIFTLVIVPS